MVKDDRKHQSLLRFIRRVVDVPLGYSKQDMITFRTVAIKDHPSLVPLIDEYIRLAARHDSDVEISATKRTKKRGDPQQMHLFDLLREKKLFPSNNDLSDFAGRILPNMSRRRFNKMKRSDIAARIIEYLETLNGSKREALEASMREAMVVGPEKAADRKSFFSTWEKIIKGIEL